jgi:hypothetical protein
MIWRKSLSRSGLCLVGCWSKILQAFDSLFLMLQATYIYQLTWVGFLQCMNMNYQT